MAKRYNDAFAGSSRIVTPRVLDGAVSTWAQYTLQIEDRARFQADLKAVGVPTAVYYPIPLSKQMAYAHFPAAPTPVSVALSRTVVSLPMHPYLESAAQDRIIAAVLRSAGYKCRKNKDLWPRGFCRKVSVFPPIQRKNCLTLARHQDRT